MTSSCLVSQKTRWARRVIEAVVLEMNDARNPESESILTWFSQKRVTIFSIIFVDNIVGK